MNINTTPIGSILSLFSDDGDGDGGDGNGRR